MTGDEPLSLAKPMPSSIPVKSETPTFITPIAILHCPNAYIILGTASLGVPGICTPTYGMQMILELH